MIGIPASVGRGSVNYICVGVQPLGDISHLLEDRAERQMMGIPIGKVGEAGRKCGRRISVAGEPGIPGGERGSMGTG